MDYRGDPDARPSHVHTSALHSSPSVESGVAEELPGRNNLKLLLPKSLKDIEGALHNIDDIRSTPHGSRGEAAIDLEKQSYTSQGNARGAPPSLRGTGARPSGR